MVDLHTHSAASDGTLSPKELVAYAAERNLSAIAVTDHDTIAGVHEAVETGRRLGVQVIPGIELEVEYPRGVFHMLGLGLKQFSAEGRHTIARLQEFRTERNLRMVAAARKAGIPLEYHELTELAGEAIVGRPHFARLLVRKQIVRSEQDAFDRYLADGQRLHVKRERLSPAACIRLIHEAGGTAVLAHPRTLLLTWTKLEQRLRDWKELGLDGVEAYHANAPLELAQRFEAVAEKLGLLVTAGSDFHGPQRADRRLGFASGGMPIPEAFAEPFLNGSQLAGSQQ